MIDDVVVRQPLSGKASGHEESEREVLEMSNFWQAKAKGPAPPDPRPYLEQVSAQIVIHRLADNLQPEYAREVQKANFQAFKRMAKAAYPQDET
jgi:hypothetical protein